MVVCVYFVVVGFAILKDEVSPSCGLISFLFAFLFSCSERGRIRGRERGGVYTPGKSPLLRPHSALVYNGGGEFSGILFIFGRRAHVTYFFVSRTQNTFGESTVWA